jgi:hypothetical protein
VTDHDKTIGRLEAHVDDLRADVRALRADIGELKELVQQAKGAKAMAAWLAGLFGGAGGLLAAWLSSVGAPR